MGYPDEARRDEAMHHDTTRAWAAVILLAGQSRRMGRPKQHVAVGGKTFLEHVLHGLAAVRAQVSPPWLFVGQDGDAAGRERVAAAGGVWLVNPRPEDGPLSSIRVALPHLPAGWGFLLWPIDHPLVRPATLTALMAAAAAHPTALTVPSVDRQRGHPVVFPAWAVADLHQAPLDEGARWVFQRHPERIVHVEVDDPWVRTNLNTPELVAAAERWLAARPRDR
jgi:molybdenum cofactor cytidylyltransferase